ncbi:hypothetical protein WJX72_012210 [[Myrmecia] bisecta]|uniref:Uncharacterized protein n=1 Tax=[Myrmecia] bisecta TaxID=41462 RepID=A0AAW1RBC8_9CHLO
MWPLDGFAFTPSGFLHVQTAYCVTIFIGGDPAGAPVVTGRLQPLGPCKALDQISQGLVELPKSEQLELDERDVWEGSEPIGADAAGDESEAESEAAKEAEASDSSSESDMSEQAMQGIPAFRGEGDPHSSSTQGLHLSPSVGSASAETNPIAMPSLQSAHRHKHADRGQRRHVFGVQSLPAGHIKMGTSAPINIPMMATMAAKNFGTGTGAHKRQLDQDRQASTFVPPHLLEQQAQRTAATQAADLYTGVSPSASLKREKLIQRNAILRRTGFIESLPGHEPTMEPIKESHLEVLLQGQSALSQALGTSPAVRSSAL